MLLNMYSILMETMFNELYMFRSYQLLSSQCLGWKVPRSDHKYDVKVIDERRIENQLGNLRGIQ